MREEVGQQPKALNAEAQERGCDDEKNSNPALERETAIKH